MIEEVPFKNDILTVEWLLGLIGTTVLTASGVLVKLAMDYIKDRNRDRDERLRFEQEERKRREEQYNEMQRLMQQKDNMIFEEVASIKHIHVELNTNYKAILDKIEDQNKDITWMKKEITKHGKDITYIKASLNGSYFEGDGTNG